jgi:hypothetical protein
MLMPEAPAHFDHGSPGRKYNVRRPREVSPMQLKAKAKRMSDPPNGNLWIRVLGANARHGLGALLGRYSVHHFSARGTFYGVIMEFVLPVGSSVFSKSVNG